MDAMHRDRMSGKFARGAALTPVGAAGELLWESDGFPDPDPDALADVSSADIEELISVSVC